MYYVIACSLYFNKILEIFSFTIIASIFYNHSMFLLLMFRFSKGTWTVNSIQTMRGWRQLFITSMMSKTLLKSFYWRLVFCATVI